MRHLAMVLGLACVLVACAQPTYVTCESSFEACDVGCVDVAVDHANCGRCGHACNSDEACAAGTCVPTNPNACTIGNGGCSPDALCMDLGGPPLCECKPGFTGDGTSCAACTMCGTEQFASQPCTPIADTTCSTCRMCSEGQFAAMPCSALADRVCVQCSTCAPGTYFASSCTATSDTLCMSCEPGCLSCSGPGATCNACAVGLVLSNGSCVPAVCGNAVLESGEMCDDGNMASGDGCSSGCAIEAGSYCFGDVLSSCQVGSCVTEAATALPLGSSFALDGAGTASSAGLLLTQRSTIHTTAPVNYPVLIEATVVYSGADVTYAGTRGNGLTDGTASGEPTDALRARLSASTVELATGPGTTVIKSAATPFVPQQGIPYLVRFVDDGLVSTVEWIDMTNPSNGTQVQQPTSYHGSDDIAFVGGGDQGAVTVSNIRVCSAPPLPVTSGLVAHYSAIPSWTVARSVADVVETWADLSGNSETLSVNGSAPVFAPGVIGSQKPAVDFASGKGLVSPAFALTTDVSVFIVIDHRPSAQWGAIAHHGSRDDDWSMEQNGSVNPDIVHWQTNNDNTNEDLTLTADTSYVMTGIFSGTTRYFSATALDGTVTGPATINDASHTITAGSKAMYVGTSDNAEASNAAIGELVYFNRALSTVERDAVINYLRGLWRPH